MKRLFLWLLGLGGLLALLVGWYSQAPGSGGIGRSQGQDAHVSLAYLVQQHHQGLALEDELQEVRARALGKALVIDDLLAGRLTFLEAAARFRGWNREAPPAMQRVQRNYIFPGVANEQERACLEVIRWVDLRLVEMGKDRALARRLQEELAEHRRRGMFRSSGPTARKVPGPRP
jgi:hypothetical protein